MTAQVIPTFSDVHSSELVTLEGTGYLLAYDYNQRCNCWYLTISMADGTLLAAGMKIVCNWPLTRKTADPRLPQGDLFCLPSTTDDSPPGLSDLATGGRCTLVYVPSTDLP